MKISVQAKPNASRARIKKTGDVSYSVSVKEPALNGRANQAVLQTLADYFQVSISEVSIIKGQKSRNKVVEIKN